MEGFAEVALDEFFTTQVSESMRIYGPPFNEFALGFGKFISVIFILIFKAWFGEDVGSSRLDRYYAMLGILSFLNLFLFSHTAYRYADPQVEILAGIDHRDLENGLVDSSLPLRPNTMRGQCKSLKISPQESSVRSCRRSLYRIVTIIGCESRRELCIIRAAIKP